MNENTSYEIITQLDSETGDTIIPLPKELLDKLGWKEDDEISIVKNNDGTFTLSKV
jgi:bifunctional DNA-binding transcriptional regulator/antitoxin component of YhaV-PrlF toxin-antitoxin module